ncbi:MAG: hypothetical protein CR968_03775 [Flavobacteriia bacterium]|nr:MAG: hypothetical protein CR968_03775 [Flavobacteriia bacterium]
MVKRVFSKYALSAVAIVIILTGVVSCEKDFKNIGVDIVDNNIFSSETYQADIRGYSKNIDKNMTDGMSHYMLGYYEDNAFGSITSSIATQLGFAANMANPDYGQNAVIDSVVVIIPYLSTLEGTITVANPDQPGLEVTVNNYEIDSMFSSNNHEFNISVYELGTYLNNLDPNDPFTEQEYYNNQAIATTGVALYEGILKPKAKDTVMYINRSRYTDATLTEREVYKVDTIKLDADKPFMSLPLDTQTIKEKFQDEASSSHFSTVGDFQHYFRGLMLQASPSGTGNALLYLNLSEAVVNIYYTESQILDEAEDEDLDDDGVNGETEVVVAKSSVFKYPFAGKTVNLYTRDYAGSVADSYLTSPDTVSGNDKLFIQGAAGSDAIIHLFGADDNANDIPDELETLRSKNWLIDDAKLYLYIDETEALSHYPERVYLYEIEDGKNYQPYELFSQGINRLNGKLVYDDDENPDYYLFHLTDYVSKVVKPDSEQLITDFGIKAYDSRDNYNPVTGDTIMTKYNNNFKGVVIHGNDEDAGDRRLQLEIYYTQLNN